MWRHFGDTMASPPPLLPWRAAKSFKTGGGPREQKSDSKPVAELGGAAVEARRQKVDGLIGFVAAALALAGSPGPATLGLAATGAAFGAWRGLAYLTGIVCGMVLVIVVTAAGIEGVIAMVPGLAPALLAFAAAYIIWLAWRIATAPPMGAPDPGRRPPGFLGGVLLSLVNPKGYAAMAALFSGFVVVEGRADLDLVLKFPVLVAIMLAVDMAWLVGGASFARLFRDPAASRVINLVFALLLVASVALTVIV